MNDHQKYQEACVGYNNWLRVSREKLAACSDVYGDKDAVKSKMDKAKVTPYTRIYSTFPTFALRSRL